MRLINRPKPVPLESLASYLDRLGAANYYEAASWYHSLLSPPHWAHPNLARDARKYAELSDLSGQDIETLYGLTVHRFARYYYEPDQLPAGPMPYWPEDLLSGEGAPREYLRSQTYTPICPLCWTEHQAVLLPWSLRHVTTCLVHQVLLLDHCSHCGEVLRSQAGIRGSGGRCAKCNTPISKMETPSIAGHPESLELTRLIWHAVGLIDQQAQIPATSPAAQISSAKLLDFMRRMPLLLFQHDLEGTLFDQSQLPKEIQIDWSVPRRIEWKWQSDVRTTHVVLLGMWRLLRYWPDEWHAALLRIAKEESTRRGGAVQRFPQALSQEFPRSEWPWLYEGLEQFLSREVLTNPHLYGWLHYYRTLQKEAGSTLPEMLSQKEAARRLGVSEANLKKAISEGKVQATPEPLSRSLRPWTLVEAESVERLKMQRQSLLTLDQAATYLSVGEEQLRALVDAGLLKASVTPQPGESTVWGFDLEAVEELRETLVFAMPKRRKRENDPDVLTLSDAMRIASWRGVTMPELLHSAQAGDLEAYRDPDQRNRSGLAALWLHRPKLLDWLHRRQKASTRNLLTAEQVRKILHCKPETLRRLRDAGLLVPVEEQVVGEAVHWRYAEPDLEAFRTKYVTSEGAGEILGVTRLTVQRWAREGRIPAVHKGRPLGVTGPEIDGSHAYLFDRESLVQWRRERLTFAEAVQLLGVSRATLDRWVKEGKIGPLDDMGGTHRWFARSDIERLLQEPG